MTDDRALHLLSLAKKGGNIVSGEEQVGAACRQGKVRLIVVAGDASDNAVRRAESWAQAGALPLVRAPFSKDALGSALGRPVCALAGLTDRKLAVAFVRALPGSAQYEELLRQLERRPGRRHEGENQLEVAE